MEKEMCNYNALAILAKSLYDTSKDNEHLRERAAGMVSDGIFQCKAIHTGLVSERASQLKSTECTKEHFFSRKISARKIFELFDRGWGVERITCFIKSRSRVHYTTKEENMYLRKFQDGEIYKTWHQQYAAAGIKLVPYEKKTKQYVYKVGEVCYNNLNEVANAFDRSQETVRRRFISNSKKWKDWTRNEI